MSGWLPTLAALLAVALQGAPPGKPAALPPDIEAAILAAEQLEAQGAYEAARRQIAAVQPQVPPKQRNAMDLWICNLWRRAGDRPEARRCYARLATSWVPSETQALAAYHAAFIAFELGDEQTALDELDAAIVAYPQTDGAQRAMVWMRGRLRQRGGAAAEADYLIGLASRLRARGGKRGHRALAAALVDAGRIRLVERGAVAAAEMLLGEALQVAVDTVWADDALYWAAHAARLAKRWERALRLYGQLADAHRSSWVVGSYVSAYYDDALLELGVTWEAMGKCQEALAAYSRVAEDAPTSILVDDARFAAARLPCAPDPGGALRAFLRDHPDSRWVAAARATLQERAR